jgi:hypothetical protein
MKDLAKAILQQTLLPRRHLMHDISGPSYFMMVLNAMRKKGVL